MNKTISLKDYKPLLYKTKTIELVFHLDKEHTQVVSFCEYERNTSLGKDSSLYSPFFLNGESITLESLELDSLPLSVEKDFSLSKEGISFLRELPEKFTLKITTSFSPKKNTQLSGLYVSGNILCTQCEAEGFRRITFFPDRPDNMAIFIKTTLIANTEEFPQLLSNGNLVTKRPLGQGKTMAIWSDPFPKPCYLFALVAGNLDKIEGSYTTKSGRKVALEIYSDPGKASYCEFALKSLQKSMRWDEKVYNREYDLDLYMIVAVDSFNFGAMENKGLNIFNSVYILANSETTSDEGFLGVERVVAHEYFHNWTGNRITCRDWFQLTLKEGLTVFRENQFCEEEQFKELQRPRLVDDLRLNQFLEDQGPMAHPIKPTSYVAVENFYSATVYEKGAEVINMLYLLLGKENFYKGMENYFRLFDGQAITTEDFLFALTSPSNYDLKNFTSWYRYAGTPSVDVSYEFDSLSKKLTLTLKQKHSSVVKEENPKPYSFPFIFSLYKTESNILIDKNNTQIIKEISPKKYLWEIHDFTQSLTFTNVSSLPLFSFNEGFSAPIYLNVTPEPKTEDFATLATTATDSFAQYESMRSLFFQYFKNSEIGPLLLTSVKNILQDLSSGPLFKKELLFPIKLNDFYNQATENLNPISCFSNILKLKNFIATHLENELTQMLKTLSSSQQEEIFSLEEVGKRALKGQIVTLLASLQKEEYFLYFWQELQNSRNFTNQLQFLRALIHYPNPYRLDSFKWFYEKFKSFPTARQDFYRVIAQSPIPDVFLLLEELETKPEFSTLVPNNCRALWGTLSQNPSIFYHHDAKALEFYARKILLLDKTNSSLAASMLKGPMQLIPKLEASLQKSLLTCLKRELGGIGISLSKNLEEVFRPVENLFSLL